MNIVTTRLGVLRLGSGADLVATLGAALMVQGSIVVSGTVVARMLGPENRGHLALIVLLPVVLAQMAHLGLPQATTYYAARDRAHVRVVARRVLLPALCQAALVVGLYLLLLPVFFDGSPRMVWAAAMLSVVIGPAVLAQQYGLALLQGQRRYWAFNLLRLVPTCLYAAGALALFVLGRTEFLLVLVAWAIPQLLTAGTTVAVACRGLPATDDWSAPPRREMIRFGLKGFLGYASPVETFRLDQAVIGLFLSPAALGLYVVGVAFTNLPRFVAQSIGMVAYPRIAAEADPAVGKRSMWKFLWLTVGASALVVVPVWAGAGFLVPFFFGDEFAGAVPVTRILLVGSLFVAIRRILSDATRGLGLPHMSSIAEVTSWLALIPALALLMPARGVEGVAVALTLSAAVSLAVLLAIVAWSGRVEPSTRSPSAAEGLTLARTD